MQERGSALLTAVVVVMVLLLIAGIIFVTVDYQFKLETPEEQGLKAYYLAEAGINYGEAVVLNETISNNRPDTYFGPQSGYLTDPNNPSQVLPKELPNMPKTSPFGAAYEGAFDISVQTYPSSTDYVFTVTATGYYPSKTDPQAITRTLQEQYSYPIP